MSDQESPRQADVANTTADGDSYAVLRNRDFRLYLIGRFAASLGQQMLVFAVGWELYERTRSALALGAVGLAFMVPMVACTLPAGHVADNFNRKRIILLAALLVALASLGLSFISAFEAKVGWVYACLVVLGAARTFLWPASAAFLPHIVPHRLFSRAVTFNTGTFHLSSVVGPAVAGALVTVMAGYTTRPAAVIYALNALAALVFFVLVGLIRSEHTVRARQPLSLRNLGAGFRFVFENQVILGTITLDMFAVLLGGATALLPIYAKEILGVGPAGLGWLRTAMPMGAVSCALILAHRPPMQKAGRALLWSVAAFGLATVVFGLSRWYWLSFAMLLVCGAVDNVSVVVRHTLVQILTPDEKRGRVSAVNSLFIGTSNELGEFESGTVAHLFGPAIGNALSTGATISVVTGGIGTVAVVVAVAWIWPTIRRYGRLDSG
jgi:MFS family permease